MNDLLRELPQAETVERALLSAVFDEPDLLWEIGDRIGPETFYFERHQALYRALVELHREGSPLDALTVPARMERHGTAKLLPLGELLALSEDLVDTGRLDAYVDVLRDTAARRRLIVLAQRLAQAATRGEKSSEELAQQALAELTLSAGSTSEGFRSMRETMEACEAIIEASRGGRLPGIATGFDRLDLWTLGMKRGELWVLGGRPGSGKSSFAGMLAFNVAHRGQKVGILSLEMKGTEIGMRLISGASATPYNRILGGRLLEMERLDVVETARDLAKLPIFIDDSSRATAQSAAARARQLQARHGLDVLILDHLGYMEADGDFRGKRVAEVGAITKTLKRLAKEAGIAVFLLSQLGRGVESRSDKRPVLSDLRDSGNIEEDADIVLFLYREEYYTGEKPGAAELIVAKNREGRTGIIDLVFQKELTVFRQAERQREAA